MTKETRNKPLEPTAVLSGRSFGAEADGAGRVAVAGRRWLNSLGDSRIMRFSAIIVCVAALALAGCATHLAASSGGQEPGTELVLTNAHVSIWIPSATAQIWEGRVTSIGLYDMAPAGTTFISGGVFRDNRIECDVTIKTEQEFRDDAQRFRSEEWQEHPSLTMYDAPIGKQLKKDIRDTERGMILVIFATVEKTNMFRGTETGTFPEDIETAKRMVESIKLLKMQPDETDIFNPLTMAEVEIVKGEINYLQPYMTPSDCVSSLRIPKRAIDTSVWGRSGLVKNHGGIFPKYGVAESDWKPDESRKTFMILRMGHVLVLSCDGRGYVIAAQLDDKTWQWPHYHQVP
jgi:hypothetical protein